MDIFSVLCLLVVSNVVVDASTRVERAVNCPSITNFSGRVKYRRKGIRAVFKCPKKLTRYGAKFATCKMDGTWSEETPLCTKTGCVPLDPSLVANLDMNVVNGAVVQFSCLENYLLIGEAQAHCNGKDWSSPLPRCAAPHELTECDFEQDLCGWVQDDMDDQDWTRNMGPTQTGNTGPKHDHTYGDTRSGHYLFFETSNPTMTGHQTNLISPTYTADMSPMCFDFWYHILGPDEAGHVGSLEVFVLDQSQFIDDDGIQPLFVKEGNQGDSWHRGEIFIDKQDEPYQINIIATRALSYISDIAIDDLRLYNCSSTSTIRTSTTPTTTPPTTTPTTTTTASMTTILTSTTTPSASDSTTAIYQTTQATFTALSTKTAATSSSTSYTASTATSISSATTLSNQSVLSSQVSRRSSYTPSVTPTTVPTPSKQSSRAESREPDHTKSTHNATPQSSTAVTTTELSATTTVLANANSASTSTMQSAKTTSLPTIPSSTTTPTTAITSPSSSSLSVRSTSRKSTAAPASSTVIISPKTSAPTVQPDSKSTTQASTRSSSVSMTIKSSVLSTLSTVYTEIITGLSTLTTTPTVTSASTIKQTSIEGKTSPTAYTQTTTTETLSTSPINDKTTTIKQSSTHTTHAIKSTKSTNDIPTKSPAKSTKRSNDIPTKSPEKSTKRSNAITTKSPAKSTKRSNDITTKSPTKPTKRSNAIPTKSPAKPTKRTNDITTKSQIATNTTKSNSISVSQQRSQHPGDDTIKPLMIGLGVGVLTGLIVIGVVSYVCVRRRKFYISRYEDELKPFTNSGSNQSLNNEHYYQDEESES